MPPVKSILWDAFPYGDSDLNALFIFIISGDKLLKKANVAKCLLNGYKWLRQEYIKANKKSCLFWDVWYGGEWNDDLSLY